MKLSAYQIALQILNQHGYEAFLVGGAVRDYLTMQKPHDFDVTTNAKPSTIKELFSDFKCLNIGEKHGTITVFIEGTPIEITTYRSDSKYLDNRHPEAVAFISDIKEDVARRDFTINALLMDINGKIIDYVGGIEDLNRHLVRAIGEPEKRFNEDALRILRGIRIASQYHFEIEVKTQEAMFSCCHLLENISRERIAEEFLKIVKHEDLSVLKTYEAIFKPLLNYRYNSEELSRSDDSLIRLALLFKDAPSEIKKLFLNKDARLVVNELIKYQNPFLNLTKCFSEVINTERYLKYLEILHHQDFKKEYERLKPYLVTKNNLAISASELMALGYEGPKIGLIIQQLVDEIQNQAFPNEHVAILNHLKHYDKNAL